jgi:hypothetical protein
MICPVALETNCDNNCVSCVGMRRPVEVEERGMVR